MVSLYIFSRNLAPFKIQPGAVTKSKNSSKTTNVEVLVYEDSETVVTVRCEGDGE